MRVRVIDVFDRQCKRYNEIEGMYHFSFLFDFQQQTSLLMKAHLNYKNYESFAILLQFDFKEVDRSS